MSEPAPDQLLPTVAPLPRPEPVHPPGEACGLGLGPAELRNRVQAGELSDADLAGLVRADLQRCWQRGHCILVEAYLEQLPSLRDDPEMVLGLIYTEVLLRQGQGETLQLQDYLRRFPGYAPQLEQEFGRCRAQPAGALPGAAAPGPLDPASIRSREEPRAALPPPAPLTREDLPQTLTQMPVAKAPVAATTVVHSPSSDKPMPELLAPRPRLGPAPAAVANLPTVAGYEILSVLGRGGMGVVYKARQVGLNRLVALKMILAGAHAGSEDLARFRTEAESVASLQHPNIVQIYEVGEQDGLPFFSLEFVEGGSLAGKLNGIPQPAAQAAQLVETLARAMQVAHQHDIIHRDLKPHNILLTADGHPKIADFGLAKRQNTGASQTQSGALMGTPSYMAPEQARGRTREVGPPADIYALGAILYDLLTGRPPFQADSAMDMLELVATQEPIPPRRRQPNVPRDLDTICLKCLQKEASKRYPSALALADDLRRFLQDEPIIARPVSAWERGVKWARRRPAVAGLVAVCAVALASLVVGTVWHTRTLHERVAAAEERLAEQLQEQRVAKLRAEAHELLLAGQRDYAANNWDTALVELSKAQTKIKDELALAELRANIDHWLQQTRQQVDRQRARRQAVETVQEFDRQWREALFQLKRHEAVSLLVGRDFTLPAPADPKEAARKALAVVGVALEAGTVPSFQAYEEQERDEITQNCYELLLLLADEVAKPQPERAPAEGTGQVQGALRILELASRLHPRTHAYYLRQARYLEQLGDAPAAQQARAQAPEPALSDAFLLGYDALFERRDLQKASAYFEQVLEQRRDHFWARFFLAASSASPSTARAGLTICIHQHDQFPWSYLLRGFVNARLRDYPAAEKDFERALALASNAPARYVMYVNRSSLWISQQQWDRALADLNQAIELQPREYLAYLNRALAYREQEEWDQAREALDKAIALKPDLALLYHERAHLHLRRQDRAAALQDFTRAIQLEEPAGSASWLLLQDHLERARIFLRDKKYQEALAAAEAARQRQANYADASYVRALALSGLKRYDEAVVEFDRYLNQKGKPQAEFYQARGFARWKAKSDFTGLTDDYTRALTLEPTSERYAQRGWMYWLHGVPRLALSDFEKALELDRANGDAYSGRGNAHIRLGNPRAALSDAEEALARGPANARLYCNVARIFAQVAAKLEADARRQNRLVPSRVLDFEERALRLLRAALAAAPVPERVQFWHDFIDQDPSFLPLRRSAAFAELAARYDRPPR